MPATCISPSFQFVFSLFHGTEPSFKCKNRRNKSTTIHPHGQFFSSWTEIVHGDFSSNRASPKFTVLVLSLSLSHNKQANMSGSFKSLIQYWLQMSDWMPLIQGANLEIRRIDHISFPFLPVAFPSWSSLRIRLLPLWAGSPGETWQTEMN